MPGVRDVNVSSTGFSVTEQNFLLSYYRPENRDKYTRSKSPNPFNRRTIEVSTPAMTKSNPLGPKQQRARTASMPGENRKVRTTLSVVTRFVD